MSQAYRIDHHLIGAGLLPLVTDKTQGPYVRKITSSSTNATATYKSAVANAIGVFDLSLSADSEVQNVCIYNGDTLSFDPTKLAYIEFIARISTALGTTANTTQLAFGLAGARNDTVNSITELLAFRALASSSVVIRTTDGTTTKSDIATSETLSTTFKRFGISFREGGRSNVYFYMDGSRGFKRVAETTTFDLSALASGTKNLQFFAQIQKAANTDVGSLQIDRISYEFCE